MGLPKEYIQKKVFEGFRFTGSSVAEEIVEWALARGATSAVWNPEKDEGWRVLLENIWIEHGTEDVDYVGVGDYIILHGPGSFEALTEEEFNERFVEKDKL